MAALDSAELLAETIERYNAAWNAHDLDTIVSLHAPGMVFPFADGLILRKDVYSAAHRARTLAG